jgi:hypothetical protein
MTPLSTLLFDDGQDTQQALRPLLPDLLDQRLPVADGLEDLPAQVTAAITDLLTMPIGNLALAAWEKHARVRIACEQTSQQPQSRQVVRLVEHTVHSEQHPAVDLDVGGTTHRLLTLTLQVDVAVSAANLVIERGQVTEVHPGAASASAALSAGAVRLAQGSLKGIDLRSS